MLELLRPEGQAYQWDCMRPSIPNTSIFAAWVRCQRGTQHLMQHESADRQESLCLGAGHRSSRCQTQLKSLNVCRWEDGRKVQKELQGLDRWEVHAAHALWVEAAGCKVKLQQEVRGKIEGHQAWICVQPTSQHCHVGLQWPAKLDGQFMLLQPEARSCSRMSECDQLQVHKALTCLKLHDCCCSLMLWLHLVLVSEPAPGTAPSCSWLTLVSMPGHP